jgi:hypothetical protein
VAAQTLLANLTATGSETAREIHEKVPIGSATIPIGSAQTTTAVADSQGPAEQDSIKRRFADLLRGAAQTGTLGIAFDAMKSERQDASPANAEDGSIGLLAPVPVQPTEPPTDAIANVVTVEVTMLPQTQASPESEIMSPPVASAVQVSGETTTWERSLSSQEQEELSPVPVGTQELMQQEPQEQQEPRPKTIWPAHSFSCFGFLRMLLN